jgi:hypothetical protein
MKTKNLRCSSLATLSAAFFLGWAPCFFSGCEGRDASLQNELSELREKVRLAGEERDQAIKERGERENKLASVKFLSSESLRENFEKSKHRLGQDLASAFPGYRPSSIKAGRLIYIFEEAEPYRLAVEVVMQPVSVSALTPGVPPLVFETRADPEGHWRMPALTTLRELQASASAQAASQSRASQREPAPAPPQPSWNIRAFEWPNAPASAPSSQAPSVSAPPSDNGRRANESYEIRFND